MIASRTKLFFLRQNQLKNVCCTASGGRKSLEMEKKVSRLMASNQTGNLANTKEADERRIFFIQQKKAPFKTALDGKLAIIIKFGIEAL